MAKHVSTLTTTRDDKSLLLPQQISKMGILLINEVDQLLLSYPSLAMPDLPTPTTKLPGHLQAAIPLEWSGFFFLVSVLPSVMNRYIALVLPFTV